MHEFLRAAVGLGILRAVDYHFARRMVALAGDDDPHLLLGAALASHGVGEGDVCVDLSRYRDSRLFQAEGLAERISLPQAHEWSRSLRRWRVVGRPGEYAPLILDDHERLYLGRYWHFEQVLAEALSKRSQTWSPKVDRERLRQGLDRLFPATDEIDWQRIAATMAVLRPFSVISGGPGTGKTRTVTSILALLTEQTNGAQPRIALAAPTGKAAARLTESIRAAKASVLLGKETAERIPEEAVTLHRLLGFRPGRANPRHGLDNPLHLDVLVVDEASMVDLPMMARLLQALSERTRLILLGDKDQLSSVEAGMVLGDICGRGGAIRYSGELCTALKEVAGVDMEPATESGSAIADHIVVLKKSWRFDENSGISALARAVNLGDKERAASVLDGGAHPDVKLQEPSQEALGRLTAEMVIPAFREVVTNPAPESALRALSRLRVLCAVREGPYGVQAVNQRIEQALEDEGLIERMGEIYAGRPVMVTTNDHAQRLYNGDVGLILPDPDSSGSLRVFFETTVGVRRILPSRLPPHETVYAMTVHKSQGSEFDEVLLILPDTESRVVTRELIYTGVTRAKQKVTLVAGNDRLAYAIDNPVRRSTGLHDALWAQE